jgi:thiol-disulfide isomerase/thioredoxin
MNGQTIITKGIPMALRTAVVATLGLLLTGSAFGQETLKVGDTAPGLDIEKWVKGDETTLEKGKVYVVEFWATWCAPCRKAIPHLTELQHEYADKGLTIIGISTDEDTSKVEPFVKSQGKNMDYTVAIDRTGSSQRAWMGAAGLNGIPASFVIDREGRIMYIGNPHQPEFEQTLSQVLGGRFDPKLSEEAQPFIDAARRARTFRNWRMADKHYEEVLALDKRVFARIGLEKFEMLLVDMNEKDQAYRYAEKLIGEWSDDPEALGWLAQKIMTDPKLSPEQRDADVAMEAAEASANAAGKNSPEALAILALVNYHSGNVEKAIELQKQAYFISPQKSKAGYKRVLDSYMNSQRNASFTTR